MDQTLKITLLGTGTPQPDGHKFGTSTLVEAGGMRVLLDCGRGAVVRLAQLGVPVGSIDAVLISHFHSDHYAALPDIVMTGAIPAPWGGRKRPLRLIAPEGVREVAEGLWAFTSADRNIRVADSEIDAKLHRLDVGVLTEGVVLEENGLRIVAFEVDHGEFVKPAFGYRVEYGGHVFVHSHDTRYCDNLIKHAEGTDVLVHEVAMARAETLERDPHARTVLEHHITPREVGRVFAQVGPKVAMLTHVVLKAPDAPSLAELLEEVGQEYDQPVMVARDLTVIRFGASIAIHSGETARG
ncbi:MBL fold metallo-hydrolase [Oceaniglobus roseus]|uniref:MBL fold metallo-hydrolase n=1 Tax=Oceaniglobus roseus TaxID=1737570 RepID=UPI000C7F6BD4|nr:MBL fold metallo-hydrolase [Kandeliimicrobium roseum]